MSCAGVMPGSQCGRRADAAEGVACAIVRRGRRVANEHCPSLPSGEAHLAHPRTTGQQDSRRCPVADGSGEREALYGDRAEIGAPVLVRRKGQEGVAVTFVGGVDRVGGELLGFPASGPHRCASVATA